METVKHKDTAGTASNTPAETSNRMADATSSETLSQVEETEDVSSSNKTIASDRPAVPAPDGMPDTSGGERADGSDNAGPM